MGYQLGIDIGSSHIVAAVCADGWPQVLSLGGSSETPAVVYLAPDGELYFGRAAERRAAGDPGRAAHGFLRRLGNPDPLMLGGAAYTAEVLLARTVSWVIATATRIRGEAPSHVAVAYPTFWSGYRSALFADAFARVDAPEVPITVCSAADAVAALLTRRGQARPGTFVGFYDLGAGTFDAAVLAAMPGGFQPAGQAAGFHHADGADFDDIVLAHVLRTVGAAGPATGPAAGPAAGPELDRTDPAVAAALGALRKECKQAKEILSDEDAVDIPVDIPGISESAQSTQPVQSVHLTREEFETLIRPTVEDTARAFERAVRSVPATPADLSALLLHGGSARIPAVSQILAEAFPDIPRQELGSYADIALGAALVATAADPAESPMVTAIIAPPSPRSVPSMPPAPVSGPPVPMPMPMPPGLLPDGTIMPADPAPVPGTGLDAAFPPAAPHMAGAVPPNMPAGPHGPYGPYGPIEPAEPGEPTLSAGPPPARRGDTRTKLLAAATAFVLIAGVGTITGLLVTSGDSDSTSPRVPVTASPEEDPHIHTQAPGDLNNVVFASSSVEVTPILETAYNEFRATQSGVTVRTETTSTEDAFAKLCRGEADIVGASFPLDAEQVGDPGCADRVTGFEVAHHTIPVVVSPENTWARCLTRAQLRSIWRAGSPITKWSQIDPSFPDEPMAFFGPPTDSLHATVFNKDINGASDNHRDYRAVAPEVVAQNVAQTRNAIGFLDFVNYETAGNNIRGVDLDDGHGCTAPNAVTVSSGSYKPLCKPLLVYVSRDALRTPATAAFVNFYLPNSQQISRKAHYASRGDATTKRNVDLARELTAGVGPVDS